MKPHVTQEYLKELFSYHPDGCLIWNKKSGLGLAGARVGSRSSNGYLRTKIKGKGYIVHRLIFLFHHGYLPVSVDHADGNYENDRIENLRAATPSQQMMNKGLQRNNTTGFKGVRKVKGYEKWDAKIKMNGMLMHIGRFSTPSEAHQAYKAKAVELFGEFARFE